MTTTKKILVVDDEHSLRITLAANLELEGFEVVEADSAEAALEVLKTSKFDLVLTDIRMPGMSGVDLFRQMRKLGMDAPVVLMTGFALEELIQGALAEGAYTVLPKPFDVGHAVETLTRAARTPTVLVVDDMEKVALSTAEALNASGVKVRAVMGGEQALEVVREGDVDVCVVDMVMPGMSGPEMIEKMRAVNPSVVVIAVSGEDVPDMIRKVASMGAHTFMRKPYPFPELIRAIALARGTAKTA